MKTAIYETKGSGLILSGPFWVLPRLEIEWKKVWDEFKSEKICLGKICFQNFF